MKLYRTLNGEMLASGLLNLKSSIILEKKKCEKKPICQPIAFFAKTNQYSTLKFVRSELPVHGHDRKFLFRHRYKTVLSIYNKEKSKYSSTATNLKQI